MSKKIIVANWKALPASLAEAEDIVEKIDEYIHGLDGVALFDLVICPPTQYREEVARMLSEGSLAQIASLGAQDVELEHADALEKLGVRYVIIGHSDRRWPSSAKASAGESNEVVNEKLKAVLRAGLLPIVCFGERNREGVWRDELAVQIKATFAGLTPGQVNQCLIAYEPVWAISTNPDAKPDTPASAVQSMGLIREVLADNFDVSASTFLYGGSVTPTNAADFLQRSEISGVLVGGASVRPEDFCKILTIAAS